MWVMAGLLGASMAANAEYREVWNPPEAAVHRGGAPTTAVKTKAKSAALKTAHVTAKPASKARKTTQTAPKPAHAKTTLAANQTQHARDLPPILK